MKKIMLFAAALATTALLVSGCGSNSTASGDTAKSSDFNNADVTFAQSMIPHHQQAVEMAKLAASNASSAAVKSLATKIEDAQGPEIDTMTSWLKSWGKKVPSGSMSGMDGMDMGSDSSMPGMMSDADMKKLADTKGTEFDSMFLTMMISHHKGAIDMAKTEQSKGKNADAVALAKKIEAAQTTEINDMKAMLGS